MKLSERRNHCDKCGFSIYCDLNAAINIEREGIRVLAGNEFIFVPGANRKLIRTG